MGMPQRCLFEIDIAAVSDVGYCDFVQLNGNAIDNIDDVLTALLRHPLLHTVYLEGNPVSKLHDYFDLVLQERLEGLDGYREFAAKLGGEFFVAWGGGRTWGPKQWQEFGEYEEIYLEKLRRIFKYPFWHVCGHNLKETLEF